MVSPSQSYINQNSPNPIAIQTSSSPSSITRPTSPTPSITSTKDMSCVRSQIVKLGLSKSAIDVIMASWRKGTKSQYQTYLSKWFTFCSERKVNSLSAPLSTGIDFLASLLDSAYTYSSINTARSALSSLLQMEPLYVSETLYERFLLN